jgi:2-C-methyl-D-erythritol 4-phosphate cytidylyltransferase
MVAWSLEALGRADGVDAVVVALPAGAEADLPQGVVRVDGGATRSESVANALARAETDLVVIHDAARPLVTIELADAVLDRLRSSSDADGVIAAAPLADTVKRAGDDRAIRATEDRRELWAAQTPQAFRTEKLRAAYAADPERVASATDEAMLIEQAGGTVLIEPAPASNMKITTREDLRIAEALLSQR